MHKKERGFLLNHFFFFWRRPTSTLNARDVFQGVKQFLSAVIVSSWKVRKCLAAISMVYSRNLGQLSLCCHVFVLQLQNCWFWMSIQMSKCSCTFWHLLWRLSVLLWQVKTHFSSRNVFPMLSGEEIAGQRYPMRTKKPHERWGMINTARDQLKWPSAV